MSAADFTTHDLLVAQQDDIDVREVGPAAEPGLPIEVRELDRAVEQYAQLDDEARQALTPAQVEARAADVADLVIENRLANPETDPELFRLVAEYAGLQYPDDDVREALAPDEAERRAKAARRCAVVIADLVAQRDRVSQAENTDTDGM